LQNISLTDGALRRTKSRKNTTVFLSFFSFAPTQGVDLISNKLGTETSKSHKTWSAVLMCAVASLQHAAIMQRNYCARWATSKDEQRHRTAHA